MAGWTNYTYGAMAASAAQLAIFANELQRKLAVQGHDMDPDDAIFLLRQITSFAESMNHTCEAANFNQLTHADD